jgi:serine/threonine protein kinase
MGEVYRARDTRLGRDVAIKILPREMSGDPERIARFQREARTLATLQHPNVASVYGFEESAEARFLVMELVEGEDLAQRLARGPMSVDEAIAVAKQIAAGLDAAHERGIVHRDLKPANVNLTPDGTAKVLDFGLARAYGPESDTPEDLDHSPTITAGMTQAGTILGTASYMSPEQAKGRPVDQRADIWAWGAILWEMLAGQRLFSGDSVSDTLAGVLRQDVDVDELPEGTPDNVRRLLAKCLERDPKQRLRHIADASIYFEQPSTAVATTTSSAGPWKPVAAVATLVAIGLAVLLVLFPSGESEDRTVRRWDFGPTADGGGAELRASISPDGRTIAYSDRVGIWVRPIDELEARILARTGAAGQLTWSSDSQTILFADGQHVSRVAATGGRVQSAGTVASGAAAASGSVVWNDDGTILVTNGNTGVHRITAAGNDAEVFVAVGEDEMDFHEITAVPGGRGWVFVVHEPQGHFGRLDLLTADGERRTLVELENDVYDVAIDPAGYLVVQQAGTNGGIWAAPFDLGALELTGPPALFAAGGTRPSVSSNGTLVYTQSGGDLEGELVWLDAQGAELQVLTTVATQRPFPRLSADGGEFVLPVTTDRGRDLWTFDADTGTGRLLQQTEAPEDFATYAESGDRIYTYGPTDRGFMMSRLSPRSSEPAEELTIGLLPVAREDLGLLFYSRPRPGGFFFEICVLPLDDLDAEPRVLVATDDVNWGAAPSPDGRYLAYSSNESGSYQIYLTDLPNAVSRWQVSVDGGHWPRWSADGSALYFAVGDGVYRSSFDADDGVRVGAPELLFEYTTVPWAPAWASAFDVDASGERFLVVRNPRPEETDATRVVVVENWAAEFEAGR